MESDNLVNKEPAITSQRSQLKLVALNSNSSSTREEHLPDLASSSFPTIIPQPNVDAVYTVSCNSERPTVMRIVKKPNYFVSPIHSDESDVDDSDADPDFPIEIRNGRATDNIMSSSNSDDEEQSDTRAVDVESKKGKKRTSNVKEWEIKKTKMLRNSGKPYISSSKSKKQFSAKKMRPTCGERCRLRCSMKINDTIREDIFRSYWELANVERQREFILAHCEEIKPKYRYSSTENYRRMNNAFYFEINNTRIRVCKSFFKATLDITDRPIRTAIMKKSETGFLNSDLRGKHGKQPTVDPEIKDSVRKFINNIPRTESHYLRPQTEREYIDGGKSLADLYRDYKEEREEQQKPFANYVMFNRIFNTEFNISFFVPKKDQCDVCESYKNADEEGKQKLMETFDLHLKEKQLSRAEKENDKISNIAHVAVYDLQAVLPLPRGQVSSFYYKSKLNCYNFTISDLYAKDVDCFFWNETEGKRGSVEIGSCVLHYLKTLAETKNIEDLDIVFYSDNCCGQQKNKYLLAAYTYATNKFKIRSITHKFLIHGHSQNEGDNVHSVIEKQIKRHLKSSPIYVPEQYISLIRMAKKTGPSYRVHEFTYENFYDLKILQEQIGNNFTVDTNKTTVKWHDIKVLKVEKNNPTLFYYKTSYEDNLFKTVDMVRIKNTRSKGNIEPTSSLELVQAYANNLPLSENKKRDLKELSDKTIIPKYYYNSFYKHVLEF